MARFNVLGLLSIAALAAAWTLPAAAHDHPSHGHRGPTYEITAPATPGPDVKRLALTIVDDATGEPAAARFTVLADGRTYLPEALNRHGLRFVSIHEGKQQRATILYARGSGVVVFALPPDCRRGEVIVTKGYEYAPRRAAFDVEGPETALTVRLRRFSTLGEDGWLPADEHLHYDRLDKKHDADWLTMLAGDGLTHAHFLVLKGGNLPGIWATQYAHGKAGQASGGGRLIVPGEEFRGRRQGHINLLGVGRVIEPISIGGIGQPPQPFNYPAMHDVFLEARASGGIGGPAHGGALAQNSTAVVDTVLGAAEFFEIANTHLYKTDVWYRLMNCGFILPPVAGTDLPNFPFRAAWQPFLGETRTYVRAGERRDFESWKAAVRRGETMITSGPLLRLTVGDAGPGGTVRLPAGGGEVQVVAQLESPRPPEALEIVQGGEPLDLKLQRREGSGIHRWELRGSVNIRNSCWLAARATGGPKQALARGTGIQQQTTAHTAAVRVFVAKEPIRSPADAQQLLAELAASQQAYRTQGRFQRAEHRARLLELFDQAMAKLKQQVEE